MAHALIVFVREPLIVADVLWLLDLSLGFMGGHQREVSLTRVVCHPMLFFIENNKQDFALAHLTEFHRPLEQLLLLPTESNLSFVLIFDCFCPIA